MAAFALTPPAHAQGRFKVLIPDLAPAAGADEDFGEDVADKLRDLIDDMDTHVSVETREVRDALRKYGLKEEDMGCIQWRQLAVQMNVEIVFCGGYSEAGNSRTVDASFLGARSGEPFAVPQFTSSNDDQAAGQIHTAFQNYVQQLRTASICVEYVGSQQWERALETCDAALAINPTMVSALYSRGRARLGMAEGLDGTNGDAEGRNALLGEALSDFDAVIEQNPAHEGSLQSAGYAATLLGDSELALGYYRQMLELDPTNTDIRIRVALDLMNNGDPAAALQLAQDGLRHTPDDATLNLYIGHFSVAYAQQLETQEPRDSAQALELYRTAAEAYEPVYAENPDSADITLIKNMLIALPRVGQGARAAELGAEAAAAYPDDASILRQVASVQRENGNLDRAIETLLAAKAKDPEGANYDGLIASWLVQAKRVDEAREYLQRAIASGSIGGDDAARLLFASAINGPYQAKNWSAAVPALEEALPLAESAPFRAQIRFFAGYSLLQWGIATQDGETAATARRALPLFQRAKEHLASAGAYQEQAANLPNLRSAVDQYIDIQEAVIRRGR
jgi:tetratricopeptide (TPR) repeat protein